MRMRSLFVSSLFVSSLFLTAACQAPGPASGTKGRYDAETFYGTTSFSGASFAHDGKSLLVTSDQSGIFNAYALDLASGALSPLTHSTTNANLSVSWFPRDGRMLYTSDQGGNELDHLYAREANGDVVDLTPGEKLKASFLGWSGDGKTFFALTNERDPKFFDLYRYHFGAGPIEAAVAVEVAPGFQ